MPQREKRVFLGMAVIEQPLRIDQRLHELLLDTGFRIEVFKKILTERLVRLEILLSEDNHLGSEAVAIGVERGAMLPLRGPWTRRMLRIGAVRIALRIR